MQKMKTMGVNKKISTAKKIWNAIMRDNKPGGKQFSGPQAAKSIRKRKQRQKKSLTYGPK
jgi:hypothetical protein